MHLCSFFSRPGWFCPPCVLTIPGSAGSKFLGVQPSQSMAFPSVVSVESFYRLPDCVSWNVTPNTPCHMRRDSLLRHVWHSEPFFLGELSKLRLTCKVEKYGFQRAVNMQTKSNFLRGTTTPSLRRHACSIGSITRRRYLLNCVPATLCKTFFFAQSVF